MTSATITLTDSPAGTVSGLLTFEPHEAGRTADSGAIDCPPHVSAEKRTEPAGLHRPVAAGNHELNERLNGREFDRDVPPTERKKHE